MALTNVLTFRRLDELVMAEAEGFLDKAGATDSFSVNSLGPLIEFLELAAGNRMPDPIKGDWLRLNGAAPLVMALQSNVGEWLSPIAARLGFARLRASKQDPEMFMTHFFMAMERSA